MSMTVVVTSNVVQRFRGFLSSCMLEIASGVYATPKMNRAVRERVWTVCSEWFSELSGTFIIMIWYDPKEPGGQGILTLGVPSKTFVEYEGIILTKRDLMVEDAEHFHAIGPNVD